MNIQQQNGIVSTISFSPFFETDEYSELRDAIFRDAMDSCHIAPINHIDVFDESILTFENINHALHFLITILRITTKRESYADFNVNIKSSLCTGDYFIHQDQIYGEAVNLATKLSYASRKNELLLSRISPDIIDNFINMQNDISYFIRDDDDEQCICIAIDDEDITKAENQELAFRVEYNGQIKTFQSSRNRLIKIGRSCDSDIQIDNDATSRNHATIKLNYDKIFVHDHSSNGTYIYVADREIFLTNDSIEIDESGQISCGISLYTGKNPNDLITFQLCDLTQTNQ